MLAHRLDDKLITQLELFQLRHFSYPQHRVFGDSTIIFIPRLSTQFQASHGLTAGEALAEMLSSFAIGQIYGVQPAESTDCLADA